MKSTNEFRFGVNYVPTRQWYYSWNDFAAESVARDLDAVAGIGADHIRLQLLWPVFQPNPKTLSAPHLERLRTVMGLAAERGVDVCVTALNGHLSGYQFLPPFERKGSFFSSDYMADAQRVYFEGLAGALSHFDNFIGFDLGNELNCCWQTPDLAEGDAWFERTLDLVEHLCPDHTHVNGVDHQPWFQPATFSPSALAARQSIVALHCWIFFTGALQRGGPLDPASVNLAAGMTALAKAWARDRSKPVWVQEFGASPEWMEKEVMPEFLERSVESAAAAGASWFTWWASHDIDRSLEFDSLEYDLGLITVDNTVKPHGEAFRRIAKSYKNTTPTVPADVDAPPNVHTYDATWAWLMEWIEANGSAS